MHRLLQRQIKKFLSSETEEKLLPLFDAITGAYQDYENERTILERSLELVSEELNERNAELKLKLNQLEETHHKLSHSMAVLDGIFDATGELILAFNSEGQLIRLNNAAQEILDQSNEKVIRKKQHIQSILSSLLKDPSEFLFELRKLEINTHASLFGNVELRDRRIFEYHTSPQLSEGQLVGRVWCFRNITQIKENEALVQYQAFHDALTNLPNRVLLLDRITHAIDISLRRKEMLAILFIDLDHFKKVNDTAGHQVGDKLLIEVSNRIKSCIRGQDTLARFGGDEFVILMENLNSHQVAAHCCQRIIKTLKLPYELNNTEFHISSSIGVSIFPRDDTDPEELIRKADLAMYHAKENGRSNFEFFDSPLERIAHFQLDLENKLRIAIENKQLCVFYQPLVETKRLIVTRMEALLRWFPERGKPVSPTDFIPVAERAGLIIEIGRWVLAQVCQQIKIWNDQSIIDIRVAVNLSAQQFNDENLLADTRANLKKYGISGSSLEFEVTESLLLEDLDKVKLVLIELRKLGIKVAIDDFGTGYSSLQYLQKLPIDGIKIDRSFIAELTENIDNQSIVNAIISLGHNLNLGIVAEGVEDKWVVEFLRKRQCDYIQGFYFYKPMPHQEMTQVLINQAYD